MTLDGTRDQAGRLPTADEDGPFCGHEHWLGYGCQADPGHPGRHRHYADGGRWEWAEAGGEWAPIVLTRRPEGEPR